MLRDQVGTIMELVDGIWGGSGYLCKVKWDKGKAKSWDCKYISNET